MDAREKIIALLQNRNVDIMVRMAMCLELSDKIQHAIRDRELFRVDELLETFGQLDHILEFQKGMPSYQMGETNHCANMRKMFRIFSQLECLKEDWPDYVKRAEFALFGEGQRAYEESIRMFHQAEGLKSPNGEKWSIWLEQLLVYFAFTYFCGAVYDGNVLGKMQTAVVTTLLIQEFAIAKWKESNGIFKFDMFVDIAHRISREIEHSDINLVRLEKICEKASIFHTKELLRVILYS